MVRPARQQDFASVLALIRAIPSLPQWEQSALAPPAINVSDTLSVKRQLLVAEEQNVMRGFAQYSVLLDEAELEGMAVSPDVRRQGIGRELLHAVIAAAQEDGAATLRLEVRAGNHEALALYIAAGFVATARRPGYYRAPIEDAVILQRTLRPQPLESLIPIC